MTRKQFIEKKTGVIYGTYRFARLDEPTPVFLLIVRPPNPSHVRFEIGMLGRAFYLTWGHEA
jgi:hypothetical protein